MNRYRICIIFFFALVFTPNILLCQDHSSSDKAYPICQNGHYTFDQIIGEANEDLDIATFCESPGLKITHPFWIKFKLNTSSNLQFILEPLDEKDDIDFVVFIKNENGSLQPIRCMVSGLNEGLDNVNNKCFELMGLNDFSNDVIEKKGCGDNHDNFLKSIVNTKLEEYYLLVNNYNSETGFNISIESASNDFEPYLECLSITNDVRLTAISLFPNPAMNKINISFPDIHIGKVAKYKLRDITGRNILEGSFQNASKLEKINISTLAAQSYILTLSIDNDKFNFPIQKI